MATFAIRNISPVRAKGDEEYLTYPLAAAQDFSKGAPAVLLNGATQETGTDPAAILGFFTSDAASYAWQADTFGNVTASVPVAVADQEFRGTLEGTAAVPNDIDTEYGLVESGGVWVVDRSETGAARVVITGFDDVVENGDIDAPCTFRVLAANRQVTG
jgi:hypothetical protein